jgi:L-fuculose-phosphate aldolase
MMSMLSSAVGGTRRLVLDVGRHGLLFSPVRRALVEPAATASNEFLRLLLSYYGERLWQAGLIAGSCGNLSARLSRGNAIYITPHATSKASLRRSDIQRVSLDDGAPDPKRVSVEFPMHRACYHAADDVGAVIHTHAAALTALGLTDIRLEELLPEVQPSLGKIVRIPHAPAGSAELAQAVGDAVADGATLLLLEHHGAVTVGESLGVACDRMELGELSARAVLLARG